MKLTIAPTDRIILLDGFICRIWQGTTEKGTTVFAYVRALAVPSNECDDAEMAELIEVSGLEGPEVVQSQDIGLAEETEFRA